jgi:hypothetical protein
LFEKHIIILNNIWFHVVESNQEKPKP